MSTSQLLKDFHKASNQAQGAEKLYNQIWRGLSIAAQTQARAYCDELTAVSEVSAKTYQAQVADEQAAERRAYTNRACPVTPLDEYHALLATDQAAQQSGGLVVVACIHEGTNALAA